jgi:hypothetical protein
VTCLIFTVFKLFIADATITPVDIQKMLEAGLNVAKLKLTHTTKGEKMRLLGKVDHAAIQCCQKYGVTSWPIATCIDLKTCIVKTGLLKDVSAFCYFLVLKLKKSNLSHYVCHMLWT